MSKKPVVLLVVVLALASAAATAQAINEPAAYGIARLGSLQVTSGAVISSTSADMRGFWSDTHVACGVSRRLKVTAKIWLTNRSAPLISRSRSFNDPNCGEGGPAVGWTISARAAHFACPDGSWKPGSYSFLTKTKEPRKGLTAEASLNWTRLGHC